MNKKHLLSLSLAGLVAVSVACSNDEETNQGGNEGNATQEETTNNEATESQEEEPAENNETAVEDEEASEQMEMPEPDLEGVPDIVAEVNGEEIPKEEFEVTYEGQFQQAAMQSQMTGEEVDQDQLKQQIVESMIGTELLIQAAENGDFEASEEDIQETLNQIAAQNGMESGDEFIAAIEEQGTDEEEVMSQLEVQVKIDQLIASETGEINPTDEELQEFYDQMIAQQGEVEGENGEEAEVPSFEEVKPQVEEQVRSQKEAEAAQLLVEKLREDADVTINL
ncbi:peptidylprolyl isomerase [Salipaludibacillus neizhouensis]|uniref:Peptidylprolyl isomerase n=1 Tax=Salipaludibacillus neizhouensis TaxID=885475 RepID=A0A3A9KPL1_9BACI|nr:SurA N-terminal domain-containing protein [Salipaludibacillus neizhouensis]RKL66636.1 peptidylprolyl isomerase [Salipaludibacillus neizhouensis]